MKSYSLVQPIFKTILAACFSVCFFSAPAQKFYFDQLGTAEGLPSDYVNTIFQDRKGNLWIGTDKGVCRNDGRHFICLNKDNGLSSNFVYSIDEDNKGNIWIGTFEGGLCCYDGENIKTYFNDSSEFKTIHQIIVNDDGSFFVVTAKIDLYYFSSVHAAPQKVVKDNFCYISPNGFNRWLVKSASAVYVVTKNNNELQVKEIWKMNPTKESPPGNIFNGRFLMQTGEKVNEYEITGDTVQEIKNFSLPGPLSAAYEKSFAWVGNDIWIGADGLYHVNEKNEVHFLQAENGLDGNLIRNLCLDRQNHLYVCTYGGGVRLWNGLYMQQYPVQGKVNFIYPANHTVILSTTKTVYQYDNALKECNNLGFDNFTSFSYSHDNFYLGTYNSFYKLPAAISPAAATKSFCAPRNTELRPGAAGFYENNGLLCIGTFGDGICIYDRAGRKIDSLTTLNKRISSQMIEALVPLKNSIAALTYGSGINIIDSAIRTKILTQKDGLLSNTVYSAFQEKDNEIWIGTANGLNLYDGNKISSTWSASQGLTGTKIICIFRDAGKKLWVLSDRYLHLVEGNRLRALRSYPLLVDEKNSFNRASYDVCTNKLYIGLTNSFLAVDMGRIKADTVVFAPALRSVFLNKVKLPVIQESLQMDETNGEAISFKFSYPASMPSGQADIYYQLKGFDGEWKLLSGDAAIYQSIPPGRYQLYAKAVNSDGYASPEVMVAVIKINVPFWKSGWFRSLLLAFILIGVFFLGRFIAKKRYERRLKLAAEQRRMQTDRERIARELHDNVGSQLTYLINKIEDDYPMLADKNEASRLSNFARGTMKELRETIWALDKNEMATDELENKLRQLSRMYNTEKTKVVFDWQIANNGLQKLNSTISLNIYRIVQEALNNAAKYSGAAMLQIKGEVQEKEIFISVADNGAGFEYTAQENGYGLRNMKRRAEEINARLIIEGKPSAGTTISLLAPV